MKTFLVWLFCLTFSAGANAATDKTKESTAEQGIVKLAPEHFKPAFTKKTVIKLNAIVSRQLEVINEYDAMINAARKNVKQHASQQKVMDASVIQSDLVKVSALSERAKQNLEAMTLAEKALRDSGESYNKATFAGMMDFVEDVEREVSAQRMLLSSSLKDLYAVSK